MASMTDDRKRRLIREYFEGSSHLGAILLIVAAVMLLFIGFAASSVLTFLVAFGLAAAGIFLIMRKKTLSSDAQLDKWMDEDRGAHDFVGRAKDILQIAELVRTPILLFGPAAEAQTEDLISGVRVGDDGLTRQTPGAATVILCSADQLGIYRAVLDFTTGNRANEMTIEVFYQDVTGISVRSVSETIDTKNALRAIKAAGTNKHERRIGLTKSKMVSNLGKLKAKFSDGIVADLLQRDLSKIYRIDLVDGDRVAIPMRDGRLTSVANAELDQTIGDETARAMVALRAFVRDKKRSLLQAQLSDGGAELI